MAIKLYSSRKSFLELITIIAQNYTPNSELMKRFPWDILKECDGF